MLNEIEDFDCNPSADIHLNRCIHGGLSQGCFSTRDDFAADFHGSFIGLVARVCSMVMNRLRAWRIVVLLSQHSGAMCIFDILSKGLAFHTLVFTRIPIVAL